MKKILSSMAFLFCVMQSEAQTLYVNTANQYRPVQLGEVGEMWVQDDNLQIGTWSWPLSTVDSLTFSAPSPTWIFQPESSMESVSSTGRITSCIPCLQDAATNEREGAPRIGRWTAQTDGSYQFMYHSIASAICVDFSAMLNQYDFEEIAITAIGGEALAYPFTYNATQSVDWLTTPTATGTLTYKSGSNTYLTSMKSDVVVLQHIPAAATQATVFVAPVKLSKGILVTLVTKDGMYLSQSFPDLILDAANQSQQLTATLTPAQCQNHGCWMALMPGATKLNMMTIPGTHDSATNQTSKGTARTQTLTIQQQLEAGVRAFDLRPTYKASRESEIELDNLLIYHGLTSTGVKWKDAMDALIGFVTEHPSETVIVNMQKEAGGLFGSDYSATWRKSIRSYLQDHSKQLVTQMKVNLTLADCRGKVLVQCRTPYGSEGVFNDVVYGALVDWQDNVAFDTNFKYTNNTVITSARVEDQYNADDNTKLKGIQDMFDRASKDTSSKWYLTFTNIAYQLFSSYIDDHAKVINPAVINQLQSNAYGRLGVIFTDFCGGEEYEGNKLLQSIIQHNFKYIYP